MRTSALAIETERQHVLLRHKVREQLEVGAQCALCALRVGVLCEQVRPITQRDEVHGVGFDQLFDDVEQVHVIEGLTDHRVQQRGVEHLT